MSLSRLPSALAAARDDVRTAIGQAAQRTGVDFSYLLAQAQSESGLNPTAKASSSSATGLYQFLDQSWLAVVKKHGAEHGMGWAADAIQAKSGGGFTVDPSYRQAVFGLREQAGPSALMAAAYASDNAAGLSNALGRDVGGTDLYFAHFLGLQGATRFLRAAANNPDTNASALFPREARANRGIFFDGSGSPRSLGEVYALMGRKLGTAGASADAVASAPTPGSLVQSLPGASGPPQLAYADMLDPKATDPGAGDDASGDTAQMLTQIEQNRVNLLKPTPAQAKLAYLMLSMPVVAG